MYGQEDQNVDRNTKVEGKKQEFIHGDGEDEM